MALIYVSLHKFFTKMKKSPLSRVLPSNIQQLTSTGLSGLTRFTHVSDARSSSSSSRRPAWGLRPALCPRTAEEQHAPAGVPRLRRGQGWVSLREANTSWPSSKPDRGSNTPHVRHPGGNATSVGAFLRSPYATEGMRATCSSHWRLLGANIPGVPLSGGQC